jgi:hypothetical protein
VARRSVAVSVAAIMPLLYSPLMTSTANTATAAWPSKMPVRLSLVVSSPHEAGYFTTAVARAPAPTVSVNMVKSSHPVLGTVRSFVHSPQGLQAAARARAQPVAPPATPSDGRRCCSWPVWGQAALPGSAASGFLAAWPSATG